MNWIERLNREAAGRIPVGSDLTVEVLHWSYAPHLPDNILHRHTYFEVCLVGAWGSGQFRVGSGQAQTLYPIEPGSLFVARPGVVHQIANVGSPVNMELFWLSFHVPVASNRTANEKGIGFLFDDFSRAADVLVIPAENAQSVGAIWNALRVTASAGDGAASSGASAAAAQMQTTALTSALLLAIAQVGGGEVKEAAYPTSAHWAAKTESDRLAQKAVQFIHQNLSRALSVREIAETLAVSPRHLTRILSAYTGVGPQEYVEQARLDRARTLLLRTDDPIKQVALLAGYADVAHFTRAFGRRFGCPPGAFRQTSGAADKTERGEGMKTPGALV